MQLGLNQKTALLGLILKYGKDIDLNIDHEKDKLYHDDKRNYCPFCSHQQEF